MAARAVWVFTLPLAAALVVGCGSSANPPTTETQKPAAAVAYDAPGRIRPHPAPPLALRNYDGRRVDLRRYRGKAVLVTFIYDHCPDVCPLIVGNLHTALGRLGPAAAKLRIVAVSTDPRGDTPKSVRAFLQAHQMTGRMDYLLGSASRLRRVWAAWGIAVRRDKQSPEFVEHSALIYAITASGKLVAAYPSNFPPRWVAHDVPLLASR